MRCPIITILLSLCSTAAFAEISGNRLHDYCSSNRSFVHGYIAGFFDKATRDQLIVAATQVPTGTLTSQKAAEDYSNNLRTVSGKIGSYCLPDEMTIGQAGDVFCKYLTDKPADRHLSGAHLVKFAVEAAWPCKN